jgi:hypothetical protein
MGLETRNAATQRAPSYKRATWMQAPLALGARWAMRGEVMPWAAPRMTAYDLPIDGPLRPDVASRAARSVIGAAGQSASAALDKDGQIPRDSLRRS